MPEPAAPLALIGRDRALTDRVLTQAWRELSTRYDHSDPTESRRGGYFDLRTDDDGHTWRVTVELVGVGPEENRPALMACPTCQGVGKVTVASQTKCEAFIRCGPGHQSKSRCERLGVHQVHQDDEGNRWTDKPDGADTFRGYFGPIGDDLELDE